MPRLKMPHRGWTNEHIAKSILSKFCFITEPACPGDDVGTDLFCTHFKIEDNELYPQNSFAIQIKSNYDNINISNNIEYYSRLEIPFFVGVIDTSDHPKLKIYSGESICHFFSFFGNPMSIGNRANYHADNKVLIRFFEERNNDFKLYEHEERRHRFFLNFPIVKEIEVTYNYEERPGDLDELFKLCQMIQRNVSSKIADSHFYRLYDRDNEVRVYAGPGSALIFRENFINRFTELVENLKWIKRGAPELLKENEIETYKKIYQKLQKLYGLPKNDTLDNL